MACNCDGAGFDFVPLEPCLAKYAGEPGTLIPILQQAQALYGWLPPELLLHIARRTNVKFSKVLGVVTFYKQFRTAPAGKHLILLCQGTACHVNGAGGIEEAVRSHLGVAEGEITADGLFSYSNVACLGCCSLSPVMMIGDKTYGNLTRESAVRVLKEIAINEK